MMLLIAAMLSVALCIAAVWSEARDDAQGWEN